MELRKLGNSDVKVTPIAFGAWAIGGLMWGGNDDRDALQALEVAYDQGITTFDTAPVYGFGHSEELVGRALKTKRDKVQILTKYGLRWDATVGEFHFSIDDEKGNRHHVHRYAGKESVIRECEASLRRLQTDYIDLYQIHWPDPTTPIHETMEAVAQLLKEGKIRAAGVSNYNTEQLKEAQQTVAIAANQVPYSMINRAIEKELVPYAQESNVGILAYSPLQRGLLTGKMSEDYTFGSGDTRQDSTYFKPDNIRKVNQFLDQIRPIAKDKDVTLSQLVINWTYRQPGITCALVGARNRKQMEENAKAASIKLSEDELSNINTLLKNLHLSL